MRVPAEDVVLRHHADEVLMRERGLVPKDLRLSVLRPWGTRLKKLFHLRRELFRQRARGDALHAADINAEIRHEIPRRRPFAMKPKGEQNHHQEQRS